MNNTRSGLLGLLPALGVFFESPVTTAESPELDALISAYTKANADMDVATAQLDTIENLVDAARPVGVCNSACMSGFVGFGKKMGAKYLTTDEDALRADYERHIEFFCFGTAKEDGQKRMDAAIAEIQRQKVHFATVLAETHYRQLCQEQEELCDVYWEAFDRLLAYRPRNVDEATRKAVTLPHEPPFEIIKGAA